SRLRRRRRFRPRRGSPRPPRSRAADRRPPRSARRGPRRFRAPAPARREPARRARAPEARRCGCVAWLTSRGSPRRPTWPRRVACIPARARCEASRLPSCPRRRDASPCLTRGGGDRPRSMRIVVVMDPPSTVKVDEDTSFALMIEAEQRGHRVDHCLIHDLYLDAGRVWARVRRAHCELDPARPITLGEAEDVDLATVDAVLMRKDPPFD